MWEVLYGIAQFTILSVIFEMGEDFKIAMAKYISTLQLHCPLMENKIYSYCKISKNVGKFQTKFHIEFYDDIKMQKILNYWNALSLSNQTNVTFISLFFHIIFLV